MARPQTALNAHGGMQRKVGEQQKTSLVYGYIGEGRYSEAVKVLNEQVLAYPSSRAGLSLLGHCYYYMQEFGGASNAYEQLVRAYPYVHEYRLYLAQSLYKAGLYDQANRACHAAENDTQNTSKVMQLQAAIRYEQDDLTGCRAIVEEGLASEPDTAVAKGCLAFKDDLFEEALTLFGEAKNQLGYSPDLIYNMAVCRYKMGQYGNALKHVAEIIERGVHEHPELSVGSNADGVEVRSVGNSQILKESMLIEAFNLKAAIEYQLKKGEAAKEALTDMPPRSEDELDAVTLHNQALVEMDTDPNAGLKKLRFLLEQPTFPPETFGNLLLLYCKLGYYDLAADVLAANAHLHESHLGRELHEYLSACILVQSSPEEAYRKFDELSSKHIETLRKLTKAIQDARIARDVSIVKSSLAAYDDALERYMPVLMAQANIYWDRHNYAAVERLFKASAEFCADHDTWTLNVAHTFFMQENKFKEAIRYYEPIVKAQAANSVLDVTAMVLANLCVSYIMTSQNDVAQELMNQIEKEEERAEEAAAAASSAAKAVSGAGGAGAGDDNAASPDGEDVSSGSVANTNGTQLYHLCIVNLVIGTLYCAKFNYKFGISRIMKSLEPYHKKLSPDTWFYAKRCLLSAFENLSKQMMVFSDDFFYDVIQFLDAIEEAGRDIKTVVNQANNPGDPTQAPTTVASEARHLKSFCLRLRE